MADQTAQGVDLFRNGAADGAAGLGAVALQHDLAVTLHRIEPARQSLHLVGPHLQRGSDRCGVLRLACGAEDAENVLATWYGIGKLAQKRGFSG